MDLSKAERQAPAEQRRSKDPYTLRSLLRYILCYFLLISLSLLILAAIFCVVHDVSWVHKQQQQHRQRDQINGSRSDGQGHRYFRWRFFNCQKYQQQPQQETKLDQLQKPKQDQGHLAEPRPIGPLHAPTYQPIYHAESAGGDHVKAEAAGSEPQPILAEEPSFGFRNLMRLLMQTNI